MAKASGIPSPQRLPHPLPSYNPTTPPKSALQSPENKKHAPGGYASSDTPLKESSASVGRAPTGSKPGPSYAESPQPQVAATPIPPAQKQLDKYLESELRNAIFCDPDFSGRFLDRYADKTKLDQVQRKCQEAYDQGAKSLKGRWKLPGPSKITSEKCLYKPLLDVLNTIKRAVDTVVQTPAPSGPILPGDESTNSDNGKDSTQDSSSDHDPSGDYVPSGRGQPVMRKRAMQARSCSVSAPRPLPKFIDTSRKTIASDRAETELIKPDFVLFENESQHWETVGMPVEVKQKTTHQKAAMKQLARYARAVFAHQIHRHHLYAMTICATEATFVRFDRAGIVYSPPIDLREESDRFTRAFASLLMLDRTGQGYDPAFVSELNAEGRLDFYVDLPKSAFATEQPEPESESESESETQSDQVTTYRFKVVEKLCHRRSICGRATIVLRIRRAHNDEEYILKIMWREPWREPEGEVLKKVKGRFGLAQYVWHSDASGLCHCELQATGPWECKTCRADTPAIDKLQVCDNLTDLDIEVPPENQESEQEQQLPEVDTRDCRWTSQKRPLRICGFIVISSKGVKLDQAKSPRDFMEAVLDAILGYWGLFNSGYLHRDISEGNVMLLKPGQDLGQICDDTEITDTMLIESEKKLREILEKLGRKPTGMLSDYDLHSSHLVVPATITPLDAPSLMPPTAPVAINAPNPASTNLTVVHTSAASSRSSRNVRPREEDAEDETQDSRGSKKRKTMPQPGGSPRNPPIEPTGGQKNEGDRGIDFRTGTPAFMSIRVIEVAIGQRYNHSFLDDIESFFWLILWMAAAHLDDGERATGPAQSMLNQLNMQHSGTLANTKLGQLARCITPSKMKENLEKFGNSWARSPLFSEVIINFGTLAFRYHSAENEEFSPLEVFPEVVGVFQRALYPQLA